MTDLEKELVEKLAKAWVGTEQNPWDLVSEEQRKSWEALCIEGYLPHIRSYTQALVAAAYAACAEHLPPLPDATLVSCSCGAYFSSRAAWQAHIRSLTPADAARELDRREDVLWRPCPSQRP